MKVAFNPTAVAAVIAAEGAVSKLTVSTMLSRRMTDGLNTGAGNPFDNYFDFNYKTLVDQAVIGVLWGLEVVIDDDLPDDIFMLEVGNSSVNFQAE